MSFTSLSADKTSAGSIKRWVNYSEIDVEQIIEEAQALICQTLRVREMRHEFDPIIMSAGAASVNLPTGFLDPIALKDITNNLDLALRDEAWLARRRIYEDGDLVEGVPLNYAIYGEKLQFELKCQESTTLILVGYKAPAALSTSAPTNFLTSRFPHLMRQACIAQAADMMNNDGRYQRAISILTGLIQKINEESDLSYRGLNTDIEVV
jgi:hypothetical protein